MPKSRSRGKPEFKAPEARELTDGQIMALVMVHGVACFHSSGRVILNNGTWLQPEQWQVHLEHTIDEFEKENGNHAR
jgi:hypothetical protein